MGKKQKELKKQYENMTPVFQLKPLSNTKIKCNQLGLCGLEEGKICDDILEIETTPEMRANIGANTILFGVLNGYSILGKYCVCNITGNHLVRNNKLPVYYLSVMYHKRFVTGCLFNVYLYFTINDESKRMLDTPAKYIKAMIGGTYSIEVEPVDENFIEKIEPMIKDSIFTKFMKDFNECENDDEKQESIMKQISQELKTKTDAFNDFFKPITFNVFPSKKVVFEKMKELCDKPIIKELSIYGLCLREKERIEEKCPDQSFEMPTNVINLKEIKANPNKLDDILASRKQEIC
jgi:hypothetical protein